MEVDMRYQFFRLSLGLLSLLLSMLTLEAHPLSLTQLLANVEKEELTVEVQVMVEDLVLFHDLEPDRGLLFSRSLIEQWADTHASFFVEHLNFHTQAGRIDSTPSVEVNLSDIPPEGVHFDEIKVYWIQFRFEFPLPERPEYLTVSQELGGPDPPVPSEVTTRIFQREVLLDTATLTHGSVRTTVLDWDLDWGALRTDLDRIRQLHRERDAAYLGMSQSDRVYSYLYVERQGLRHELLLPLWMLDRWIDLPRENPEIFRIPEQHASAEPILEFLRASQTVRINGEEIAPELDHLRFHGPEPMDFAMDGPEKPVRTHSGRVAIILYHPSKEIPRELEFTWTHFTGLEFVDSNLYPFEKPREGFRLHASAPDLHWEGVPEIEATAMRLPPVPSASTLRVPALSLLAILMAILIMIRVRGAKHLRRTVPALILLGLAWLVHPLANFDTGLPLRSPEPLDEPGVVALLESLKKHIYHAFEERDEERIYDSLARSVSGDLLEDLYLQVRQSLRVEDQGGAIARVREIEVIEAKTDDWTPSPLPVLSVDATWNTTGTLEHWGHIHTRTHQYRSRFQIVGTPRGWKITAYQPLRQERLGADLRVRR